MGKIAIGKRRNAINFYKSKNSSQKLFTLLLKCIETDMYKTQIAKFLSKKLGQTISKQRLNYWLRILLSKNYIRTIDRKPILTEEGKKFLIYGEKPLNYSGHAFEVSYPLISNGTLPENNVKLKNWGYWKDRFYDIHIRVDRGKINKLVIYAPEVKANSKHDLLIKLGEKLGMILSLIERQYQCEIEWKGREILRRLEVHAPNDPEGKTFEREKINYKGKCIDINQSGEAHFDIVEGDRSLEPFEAIERYDQMISDFPSIKEMLGSVAKGNTQLFNLLAIQTETLNQTKNAILSISKAFERLGKILGQPQEENPAEMKFDAKNEGIEQDDLLQIMVLAHVPSFVAKLQGIIRTYPDLNEGSTIWLERSVAEILIRQGKAKKI